MPRLVDLDRFVPVAWLVTRGLIVALIFIIGKGDASKMQDVGYYLEVGRHLVETRTMPATEMWQYPPGATVVMVLPMLFGEDGFATAFVLLMLACDLAITLMLARASRTNGDRLGLWTWLLAMPALREYPLMRFDLVPTMFAIAALLFAVRRPIIFGALAGLGALVKAWPVVVLAANWRLRRTIVAAVVAGAVFVGGVWLAGEVFGPQDRALDNQAGRGLQNEAVAATPWHASAIVRGTEPPLGYGSGSTEVIDPRADRVADSLRWAAFAAAVLLAAWWAMRSAIVRRRDPRRAWLASPAAGADLVFAAVLLALVTSRVLSPQFMVWALGIGAVALTFSDTRMRRPMLWVLAACVLTAGVLRYNEALVLRNVLLVVASVDACWQLLRALRPSGVGEHVDLQVPDLLDAKPAAPRHAQHVGDA